VGFEGFVRVPSISTGKLIENCEAEDFHAVPAYFSMGGLQAR
jgi:hypothetical protein